MKEFLQAAVGLNFRTQTRTCTHDENGLGAKVVSACSGNRNSSIVFSTLFFRTLALLVPWISYEILVRHLSFKVTFVNGV